MLKVRWGPCLALAAVAAGVVLADLRMVGSEAAEVPAAAEALLVAAVGPAAVAVPVLAVGLAAVVAVIVFELPVAETDAFVAHVVELEESYERPPLLPPAAPDGVAALAEVEAAAEQPLSEPTSPFLSLQATWLEHLGRGTLLAHRERPPSHCPPRR